MTIIFRNGSRRPRALGSALVALLVSLPLGLAAAHPVHAQEPGTPPETTAPAPDDSAQSQDAQAADDQDTQQQDNSGDAQPAAEQPANGQEAAADTPATPQVELPKWPINDKPGPATITWDSHGLAVNAANSSLQQILRDICTATGSKVEGLNKDERVFGDYGPGQARDVLSQLLLGAGYNVIMIGDQGQGAPRQIVLSTRRAAGAQNNGNNGQSNNGDDDSADTEPDDQSVQPQPPLRPGFPGGPPRTPQQMMQERQERLQQMRQQQQQMQQQMMQQSNPQP